MRQSGLLGLCSEDPGEQKPQHQQSSIAIHMRFLRRKTKCFFLPPPAAMHKRRSAQTRYFRPELSWTGLWTMNVAFIPQDLTVRYSEGLAAIRT